MLFLLLLHLERFPTQADLYLVKRNFSFYIFSPVFLDLIVSLIFYFKCSCLTDQPTLLEDFKVSLLEDFRFANIGKVEEE